MDSTGNELIRATGETVAAMLQKANGAHFLTNKKARQNLGVVIKEVYLMYFDAYHYADSERLDAAREKAAKEKK